MLLLLPLLVLLHQLAVLSLLCHGRVVFLQLAHFQKTLPEFVPKSIQEDVYKRLGVPYAP